MTDLQRRICITLAGLALYRLGAHIPFPGVDASYLLELGDAHIVQTMPSPSVGFRKGVSIFSLGILPYLIAVVLVRLLSLAWQPLRAMEDGRPSERRKIVLGTWILALMFAFSQASNLALGIESFHGAVPNPGVGFRIAATTTVLGGFAVTVLIADQITRNGVGNGIALILFTDIVAELPGSLVTSFELSRRGTLSFADLIGALALAIFIIAFIVFIERSVRHVLVSYPKQTIGKRRFGGGQASIPLKLNNAGVLPAVFVAILLNFVLNIVTLASGERGSVIEGWYAWVWPGHPAHMAASIVLTVAITYLYSVALLRPRTIARSLRDKRATAMDARPGDETERTIRRLIKGLSLVGGLYLAAIYLLPAILITAIPLLPGRIGGFGFLIAVAVAMDTLSDFASRRGREYGDEPPSEAIAIAMRIPDQPRVSAPSR